MSLIKDLLGLPIQTVHMAAHLGLLIMASLLGLALCACVWFMVLKAISGLGI